MISIDRLRANRRNAQKSTGPRTERGKARSRQNALKHGLTGSGRVQPADEAAEYERRVNSLRAEFRPASALQFWVIDHVVSAMLRLDRCMRLETAQRGLKVERAGCCWRNDRRLEIEQLAVRLSRNPGLVVSEISSSSQGCDWLIARWETLAVALAEQGRWDDAQRSLALDLLCVPVLERPYEHRVTSQASADDLLGIVREEIQWLEQMKENGLDDLDTTEQALAEADMQFDISRPACLLRRYEASSNRMLFWGLNLLYRWRREAAAQRVDDSDDGLDDYPPDPPSARIANAGAAKRVVKPVPVSPVSNGQASAPSTTFASNGAPTFKSPASGSPVSNSPPPARAQATRVATTTASQAAQPVPTDFLEEVGVPAQVNGVIPISLTTLAATASASKPRHMNRRQRRQVERKAKENT